MYKNERFDMNMDNEDNDTDRDSIDSMDTDWMHKFEQEEIEYSCFYKEPIETITINFIYINKSREIETIHRDTSYLDNGILNKNVLHEIITNNKNKNGITYKAISILKYFIDLEPLDVKDYLCNLKKDEDISKLDPIDKITNIKFDNSINILHDLIGLYILFIETSNSNINTNINNYKNQTKDIENDKYVNNDNNNVDKTIKRVQFNITKKSINKSKSISIKGKTKRNNTIFSV